VTRVAESFSWPFRGPWPARFAIGSLTVLLLPVAFIPLLGYAIAATRSAEARDAPPPWKFSVRLLVDGFWTAVVLVLLSAPFALALNPLSNLIPLSRAYADLAALFVVAFPWGFLLLLLLPHGTSRFAASGHPTELFNFPKTVREVKRDFPIWNLAAAAMVTAWVIAVACVGLFCVGFLPGAVYAILVSAHASATLRSPAGAPGPNIPAR
jgi:Protein of unknown function (DUF4013)